MGVLVAVSRFAGRTFALWVVVAALAGWFAPATLKTVAPHVPWLLGVVMFGMGLTLTGADFREVARRPREVAIGVLAQFILMPSIAFALTRIVPMSPEIAAGVILVGCCPGGTASNVMTYLSRGDTALSVALTSICTLMAPIVTPALVWVFANRYLPVDAWSMFVGIIQVILVPLALGWTVRRLAPRATDRMVPALPLVSVIGIVLIVGAVVGANQPRIAESGALIFALVVAHNGLGLLLGWWAAKLTGLGVPQRKAISIEVGMQNSGLGATLALAHFSPLAAVPSAVFSVWHNISGAALSVWFRRLD